MLPEKNCPLCPRLAAFREENARNYPHFYNGAVPSFGDINATLLVVGLAPGLKGANQTGRPFTGDFAGDVLYAALQKHGLAYGHYQARIDDGFTLINTRITNAVRCVPPENKPTPFEVKTCHKFLLNELAAMPNVRALLCLGQTSYATTLKALGLKVKNYPFAHGVQHTTHVDGKKLVLAASYHTSRYNVNTGRLTQAMFDDVIKQIIPIVKS